MDMLYLKLILKLLLLICRNTRMFNRDAERATALFDEIYQKTGISASDLPGKKRGER